MRLCGPLVRVLPLRPAWRRAATALIARGHLLEVVGDTAAIHRVLFV